MIEFDYHIEREGPDNYRIVIDDDEPVVLHKGDHLLLLTTLGEITHVFYRLAEDTHEDTRA